MGTQRGGSSVSAAQGQTAAAEYAKQVAPKTGLPKSTSAAAAVFRRKKRKPGTSAGGAAESKDEDEDN
jgi:hypothetical protein